MPPAPRRADDLELGDLLRRREAGRSWSCGPKGQSTCSHRGDPHANLGLLRRIMGDTPYEPTPADRERHAREDAASPSADLRVREEARRNDRGLRAGRAQPCRCSSSRVSQPRSATNEPVAYLGQVLLELGYSRPRISSTGRSPSSQDLRRPRRSSTASFWCERGSSTQVQAPAPGCASRSAAGCATSRRCPRTRPTRTTTASTRCTAGAATDRAGSTRCPCLWGLLRESAPREHVDAALARVAASATAHREDARTSCGSGSARRARRRSSSSRPGRCAVADFPRASGLGEQDGQAARVPACS